MTAPSITDEIAKTPKLCKDCRWFVNRMTPLCTAPENVTPNLVWGGTKPIEPYCIGARANSSACGPDGAWFEAKEEVRVA